MPWLLGNGRQGFNAIILPTLRTSNAVNEADATRGMQFEIRMSTLGCLYEYQVSKLLLEPTGI